MVAAQDDQRILPLPPDTEFRYLGAYISLNLSSKKQIQIINNTIMNWRWRARAQKIDPAMLASTVTDTYCPKLRSVYSTPMGYQKMCVEAGPEQSYTP